MKIHPSPAFLLALLVLLSLPVVAAPLDDRISELKHALNKEAAAKAAANGPNAQGGFANPMTNPGLIDAGIDQMVAQMENQGNDENMDVQLAQLTSVFTSEEVQEATTNLLSEIHKERKEKADAQLADVKALMTRAGLEVAQAKKPEDLDDLIAAMGRYGSNPYAVSPVLRSNQDLQRQFSSAYEFAKQWQNYLAHAAAGQTDLVRSDLQSLSNNFNIGLIPRSRLLALSAPDKTPATGSAPAPSAQVAQAQAILDGIKTLDDIPPALAKLAPLRQNDTGEIQTVCVSLAQMSLAYENLKAGLPAELDINYRFDFGIRFPTELRAQLLVVALQNRFTSFQGTPPLPSEKPTDFINRVIADATNREDWELLRLAQEARDFLQQRAGLGYTMSYSRGLDSLIAASHQAAAGQFALAVQSYETALKSNEPAIPAKIIGDKLAVIQRDHPREFADGMQLAVSPPEPHVYQNAVPGMPYRPVPSGYPGATSYPTAPVPSSLLSPAANTNTAAAAPANPPAK